MSLVADRVTKIYDSPTGPLKVLDEVSFALGAGDAAAVMGPSGSGKSSLLYIAGGLEPPTSGSVRVGDQNPYSLPANALAAFRNTRVGFVFQDHCLLPQCTVLENVLIPTLISPERERSQGAKADAEAKKLVELVGLADRIDHRPAQLSGGERQRVAIARALVRQPQLLLCDEPTGNLDRAAAENVTTVLIDLHRRQNTILVVVTHSAELAGRLPIRFDLLDSRLKRS